MFGFWQSKTGNFLATNQNYLGFLVLFWDFAKLLSFPLPKNCTFFKLFLSQWKPQNCWNWTFTTENFWYYKKKEKKVFSAERMFWVNSFVQLCKYIPWRDHHIFASTFSPQMAFLSPMGPQGWDQGLDHPTANHHSPPGTNKSQVVVSSAFPMKYQLSLQILGYTAKDKRYPESRFSRSCLDHTAHIWSCDSGRLRCSPKYLNIIYSQFDLGPESQICPTKHVADTDCTNI